MSQSPDESNRRSFIASGWEQTTIYPAVKERTTPPLFRLSWLLLCCLGLTASHPLVVIVTKNSSFLLHLFSGLSYDLL